MALHDDPVTDRWRWLLVDAVSITADIMGPELGWWTVLPVIMLWRTFRSGRIRIM